MQTVKPDRIIHAPNALVLDIGCGSGRHIGAVLGIADAKVIGLDLCRNDLRQAAERIEVHEAFGWQVAGRWLLAQANGCQLPIQKAVLDAVILSEVLEHVPQEYDLLAEVHRVLKPSGFLAVSVPRHFPERVCWKLSREYRTTPGGHLRIYKKNQLVSLLQQAGFRPFRFDAAHSLHVPYWWLKCLVGIGNDTHPLVRLYHRFLTWDMMEKPPFTRRLERLLDPLMAKSIVIYCRRSPSGNDPKRR